MPKPPSRGTGATFPNGKVAGSAPAAGASTNHHLIPSFLTPMSTRKSATEPATHVVAQAFRAPTPPMRHNSPQRTSLQRRRQGDREEGLDGSLGDERRVHFRLPGGSPQTACSLLSPSSAQDIPYIVPGPRPPASTPPPSPSASRGIVSETRSSSYTKTSTTADTDSLIQLQNVVLALTPEDPLPSQNRLSRSPNLSAAPAPSASITGLSLQDANSTPNASVLSTADLSFVNGSSTTAPPIPSELELSVLHDVKRNVILLAPRLASPPEAGTAGRPAPTPPPSAPLPAVAAYNPQVHPLRPALKRVPTYSGDSPAPNLSTAPHQRKLGLVLAVKLARMIKSFCAASDRPVRPQQQSSIRHRRSPSKETEIFVRFVFCAVLLIGSVLALLL